MRRMMSVRKDRLAVAVTAMVAVGLLAAPVVAQRAVQSGRVAGANRVETAVAISQRAFPEGAAAAYLGRADDPADAVAAGSLRDGPVLLVPTCGSLPEVVATELTRLAPDEVLALGGTSAVCDALLAEAVAAAAAGQTPGNTDAHRVTAGVEIVDATPATPFTVAVDDPGLVPTDGAVTHTLTFTGTDGTVYLDDPRFTGELADGEGELVVTGRGCSSDPEGIGCQDDFLFLEISEGQDTPYELTAHDRGALAPGTYVLDQPVRWERTAGDTSFDDGQATIRVTYTVSEAAGEPVVHWETAEGTYRTSGHSEADLDRIRAAIAAGEPAGIPNGVMRRGDGGVNVGHDWHVVDVELADVTIEQCDATVAYVDEHLEQWLDEVGRFCPWSAVPLAIESAALK